MNSSDLISTSSGPDWTWGTLAERSALLWDTHRLLATRVGVAGVGHHTALLGGRVWDQPLRALAGWFSLLGDTHGAGTTGVRVTGVAPGRGLVGGQWGISGLLQTGVGAAVEAAETPVRTVQVSHTHRPAGGELAPALVSSQRAGGGTLGGAHGSYGLSGGRTVNCHCLHFFILFLTE